MFQRVFFIILLVSAFLSSANTLYSGESVIKQVNDPTVDILNDYYNQFSQQVVTSDEKCQCDSEIHLKQNSLENYYTELLK